MVTCPGHVAHRVDSYVVTLYPGGLVGIREKGRRKEFHTTVGALYLQAVRAEVAREKREKAKVRAEKARARRKGKR
jgi:hypothetical protein